MAAPAPSVRALVPLLLLVLGMLAPSAAIVIGTYSDAACTVHTPVNDWPIFANQCISWSMDYGPAIGPWANNIFSPLIAVYSQAVSACAPGNATVPGNITLLTWSSNRTISPMNQACGGYESPGNPANPPDTALVLTTTTCVADFNEPPGRQYLKLLDSTCTTTDVLFNLAVWLSTTCSPTGLPGYSSTYQSGPSGSCVEVEVPTPVGPAGRYRAITTLTPQTSPAQFVVEWYANTDVMCQAAQPNVILNIVENVPGQAPPLPCTSIK